MLIVFLGVFILIVVLVAWANLRRITPAEIKMKIDSLQHYPNIAELSILILFGRRIGLHGTEKIPSLTVEIADFGSLPSCNVHMFQERIAGWGSNKATKERVTSLLAPAAILPHMQLQRATLMMCSNAHWPISMLGAVHTRSFFHVTPRFMQECILSPLLAATNAPPSSSKLSATVTLVGVFPVKGGVEGVVRMTVHERNKPDSVLWAETMIVFQRTKKLPKGVSENADITKDVSTDVIPPASVVDFKNLVDVGSSSSSSSSTETKIKHLDSELTTLGHVTVTPEESREYGWKSGDINPIHMSSVAATLFGQKGQISHGMHVVARALRLCEEKISLGDGGDGSSSSSSTATPFSSPSALANGFSFGVAFKWPMLGGTKLEVRTRKNTSKKQNVLKDVDVFAPKADRPSLVIRFF